MANRYGAVDQNANAQNKAQAQAQAASIGATIGPDGWWYKNGQKLSHADADKLTAQAGTAVGGQKDWGLGHGTLGDITGGRIGDVHEPGWLADAQRMAVEALGTMVGIPPAVTGAVVNNIGHGAINNVGDVLKRGAAGAAQGALVGKLPGVSSLGQGASNGILDGIKNSAIGQAVSNAGDEIKGSSVGQAVSGAAGALGGLGKSLGLSLPGLSGIGDKIGDWLTGNGGRNALGAAGVLNSAMLQNQANQYAKGALNTAQQAYDAKAPLRTAGIAGMQAAPTTLPGLSTISARGNPFAR